MRLHELVETYLTFKRALGMRLCSEAGVLRAFCRAICHRRSETPVNPPV
jgi:hypothetical protein